jgi:hypothetical protein
MLVCIGFFGVPREYLLHHEQVCGIATGTHCYRFFRYANKKQ